MKTTMHDRVAEHGRQLLRVFPEATERDPVRLCQRLRKTERVLHQAAEDYCNGVIDERAIDRAERVYFTPVRTLLGSQRPKFNRDPRGYALKFDLAPGEEFGERDWGGFGLIAPDLSEEGES